MTGLLTEIKDFLDWAISHSHESVETIASRAALLQPKLDVAMKEVDVEALERITSAPQGEQYDDLATIYEAATLLAEMCKETK